MPDDLAETHGAEASAHGADLREQASVCMQCHKSVTTQTFMSVVSLIHYELSTHAQKRALNVRLTRDSIMHRGRSEVVARALAAGDEWLLLIDSDMRFPKDSFERLRAHDLPFVAANYSTRTAPYFFVSSNGETRVRTRPESTGIEEVAVVGLGLALVRAELFKQTRWPWFDFHWLDGGKIRGEDSYFCRKLYRDTGIKPWIDHDLSKDVLHVGDIEVGVQMVNLFGRDEDHELKPEDKDHPGEWDDD